VGYTDTTPDPRLYPPQDPRLKTYEGILPGFNCLAMSSENFPESWAQWLTERGYKLPQNLRDLYYKSVEGYPGVEERGKTYAPAPYSKEESETAFVTDKAEKFLHNPGTRPWFLHISYLKPHRPYLAPEPYNRLYHPDDVPDFKRASSPEEEANQHPFLAFQLEKNLNSGLYPANLNSGLYPASIYPRDEKSMRQLRATYYGLMTEVDENIGSIITLLKETGQYENTVIIFHGVQLGDHYLLAPGLYFDQTFHVPLIIRTPDGKRQQQRGRMIDAFTENIDIFPTIMDMFGADIPIQCDGRSLVPFIIGETPEKFRTEAHWEYDFRYSGYLPPGKEPGIDFDKCSLNVIRDEHYKYVYFADMPDLLFDLKKDPEELRNLAEDPAYINIVLKYAQKMLSWRMANDERTLTHMLVGPKGVVKRPRSYK